MLRQKGTSLWKTYIYKQEELSFSSFKIGTKSYIDEKFSTQWTNQTDLKMLYFKSDIVYML